MMQNNTQYTCRILFVTPAFFDLSDASGFVSTGHPAHPHGDVPLDEARGALGLDLAPAF